MHHHVWKLMCLISYCEYNHLASCISPKRHSFLHQALFSHCSFLHQDQTPAMNCPNDVSRPHFVLVPMMSQGHILPMIDMAHLLANHGAMVSFITTPANASRIQSIIDNMREMNHRIQFISFKFPCAEVGLPEGCENLDTLSGKHQVLGFMEACSMLQEPLVSHLRAQLDPPSCIISDLCHPWTGDVAREFGIPRLMFDGFGAFSSLCRYIIHQRKIFKNVADENELVVLPGFPRHLEISKARSPGSFSSPGFEKLHEKILEEELRADGVVTNSFYELEPLYVEAYHKIMGKKVWTIGPMFLCNGDNSAMAARGNKASINEKRCLQWLDSMKPGSVLYVSFGSLARTMPSQLIEIGLGLEACKRPFLWVIKPGDKSSEVETWLTEGFEERLADRCLIIRGWAPQVMILSHPSVGGFMTHCGWNSTIEGISTGVPMITWPHFAEQFLNEKLIVEVLRVGVQIGVQGITHWIQDSNNVLVKRGDIEKAVLKLMDEGKDGEERRIRAKDLRNKSRRAIEEAGSSYDNARLLIEQIRTSKIMNSAGP